MKYASAADFFETVNFGDISPGGFRDAPLRFDNHIVAIAEGDRAGRTYLRACRFESNLEAVGAKRAFVDLRREAIVVIFRNDEWACLHARAATDAARLVEDDGAEIRFEHRGSRARRGTGGLFAVHAQLAAEYPIRLRAGNDLVESNEVVVVGVEIARVLVTVAGEEIGLVLRPVVPRFARYHARPAANATGIVLNHRFRLHCRCAHARSFFLILQRNTLLSGMCELGSPTLAVRSLAISPDTMPA